MRYEVLILSVPEITQDESAQLEANLRDAIQNNSGTCLSFERWGKYRLAYPVKKNEYGVYYLLRFENTTDAIQPLLAAVENLLVLKYNELVMRYMLTRLDKHASLEYQRPESLEEIPGKVADSLLREHRMDVGEVPHGMKSREEEFVGSDDKAMHEEL